METDEWAASRTLLASGEIKLSIPVEPVSFQASRARKNTVTLEIQEAIKDYNFILIDDVQIEIEWLVNQQLRYESDASPDVDILNGKGFVPVGILRPASSRVVG